MAEQAAFGNTFNNYNLSSVLGCLRKVKMPMVVTCNFFTRWIIHEQLDAVLAFPLGALAVIQGLHFAAFEKSNYGLSTLPSLVSISDIQFSYANLYRLCTGEHSEVGLG